jgi:transposase
MVMTPRADVDHIDLPTPAACLLSDGQKNTGLPINGSLSAVSAGEAVVPTSELSDVLKQIHELQRMLGKKTMEAEILKEAVEIARSRKWIAHSPLLPGDDQ